MAWTTLFVFCRFLANAVVDRLPPGARWDPHWRLIDLWNNAYLVGAACLGVGPRARQPDWREAALILTGVSLLCLIYLVRRIRAVEIVRETWLAASRRRARAGCPRLPPAPRPNPARRSAPPPAP